MLWKSWPAPSRFHSIHTEGKEEHFYEVPSLWVSAWIGWFNFQVDVGVITHQRCDNDNFPAVVTTLYYCLCESSYDIHKHPCLSPVSIIIQSSSYEASGLLANCFQSAFWSTGALIVARNELRFSSACCESYVTYIYLESRVCWTRIICGQPLELPLSGNGNETSMYMFSYAVYPSQCSRFWYCMFQWNVADSLWEHLCIKLLFFSPSSVQNLP